jgi:hypothetical protein
VASRGGWRDAMMVSEAAKRSTWEQPNLSAGQVVPPPGVASVDLGFTVSQEGHHCLGFGSESVPGIVGQGMEAGCLDPSLDRTPHPGNVAVDQERRQFVRVTTLRYWGGIMRSRSE